jgi:hypothetical protein
MLRGVGLELANREQMGLAGACRIGELAEPT